MNDIIDSPLEPFLTIPELIERGNIPLKKDKLRELAERGMIRSYRVDKKILFLESEVYEDIQKKFKRRSVSGGPSWRL